MFDKYLLNTYCGTNTELYITISLMNKNSLFAQGSKSTVYSSGYHIHLKSFSNDLFGSHYALPFRVHKQTLFVN